MKIEDLMYFNGYGGFSKDGKEYIIKVTKNEKTPVPWSHILANEKIGTLVTSNGGGFTWYGNSRENKISAWRNDVVLDTPSEKIILEDNKNKWSAYSNEIIDGEEYEVTYGFGYAKYKLLSRRYEQELDVFVTEKPYQKVCILKLKNLENKTNKINIRYEIDVVLGVSKEYTAKHLVSVLEDGNLKIFNRYSNDYSDYNLYMKIISSDELKLKQIGEHKSEEEKTKKYTQQINYFTNRDDLNLKTEKNEVKKENDTFRKENIEFKKGNDKFKIENVELEREKDNFNNKATNYIGLQFDTSLEENEEKEFVFVLDYSEELNYLNTMSEEIYLENNNHKEIVFENLGYYKQIYEQVKKDWKNKLEKLQITTPIDSMNIILNGWMIYQTLISRVWGRASFYQSGGAFGFRDQLQDMLAILYIEPTMVKKQIIYHAKHQFKEGDVLHWWHPERSNGIRTRFSDDLLWLVYVTCEYINFTGDFNILIENIPFIEGRLLNENEDEIYIETKQSDESACLLEHCIRAINRSLDFGEHGLPKMGSGDWNDGMNTVGGESIWLGFFLADILKKILMIVKDTKCEEILRNLLKNEENVNDDNKQINSTANNKSVNQYNVNLSFKDEKEFQNLKEYYESKYFELQRNLDKAWDGRWFKRAYFKNGEALGSNQNDECKIDNISQSWSVISGVAKKEKQNIAMESVENYLVDHENMFIKLLTPSFCNTKMEPGYIKSYIPGVRENGGQYTHGAIWAIIANCILNKNEVATEYFRMLNPIEHARTKEDAIKYKSEPYVISADIYSHPNLIGRGGWTWYTGSASWYFVAGVRYILGLNKVGEYLEINPKFPKEWKNCHITFVIEDTTYVINMLVELNHNLQDNPIINNDENILNAQGNNLIIFVDNEKWDSNKIKLIKDGKKHIVEIKIK